MDIITGEALAALIIADLRSRAGLSGAWDQLDADIREEIMEEWGAIIASGASDHRWPDGKMRHGGDR